MKTLLLSFFTLLTTVTAFGQHQVYVGGSLGVGYTNNWHKTSNVYIDCFVGGPECNADIWLNIDHSLSAQAKFYALYGHKRLRVGYQLDYLLTRPLSYLFSYSPSESPPSQGRYRMNQNYFSMYMEHSVLFEYTLLQKRNFSISPKVSVGYSHRIGELDVNHFFLCGSGLVLGFDVKNVMLYMSPDYSLRFGKNSYKKDYHNNSQVVNQSILLTFGIRGDVLATIRDERSSKAGKKQLTGK